jgi:2-polyprenyl-6-methoxyphenol hydroxylase-like FAD-dependent oxidoreductase
VKVVVCGAGITGLALAGRMAADGWETAVVEQAPGPRLQGYMIDFFGPGFDAAEAMGLLPRIRELGYHVHEAAYLDLHGRRRASLSYERLAGALGGRLVSIMRPDLERLLRETLPAGVDLRFGRRLTHVRNGAGAVRAILDDGDELSADLLVGADGVHSTVRRLVFGEEQRYLRYLGFHTAAFTFREPMVHAEVTGQGYRFCLTDTIGRQMGLYGLRDGRVAVFAVHRAPGPALPDDPQAALREEYGQLGWAIPVALAHCPPADEIYYDQVAQVEMPRWSKGRVVLAGDACHAVSLLAGQGASLGIAGACLLAGHLSRSASIGAAMASYEQLWRPVVTDKQRAGRKLARWFVPQARPQLWVRRAALKIANLPITSRYAATIITGKPTQVIAGRH